MDNTTANHCFCNIFEPAFADTVKLLSSPR